jgi:DNA (cytosine-5)-methyltransferase 1
MRTWNHTSVFTGIGGFEEAARAVWDEDYNILEMVEIGEWQRAILAQTFEGVAIHDDIKTWNSAKYLGRTDLFTGGPPCQPFSTAGVRRGAADDRDLWPQTLKAVRDHRPRWVVLENVPGLGSMEQSLLQTKVGAKTYLQTDIPQESDKPPRFSISHSTQITERWFKAYLYHIVEALEKANYTVCVVNIPALAVGADHERARLWIVAHSNGAGSGRDSRAISAPEAQSRSRREESESVRLGHGGQTAADTDKQRFDKRSQSEGETPTQRDKPDKCSQIAADSDGLWKQQSQGSLEEFGRRASDCGEAAADSEGEGQKVSWPGRDKSQIPSTSSDSETVSDTPSQRQQGSRGDGHALHPAQAGKREATRTIDAGGFCERFAKPGIRGVIDGLPYRAHAIEGLGGAVVVPLVAEIFRKIKKTDGMYYGGE